ncbi:DMT family transporter [soil metagenome]
MATTGNRTKRWERRVLSVPPHAYFVVGAPFHYLGLAFAVLLFTRVEPLGVAWLRITSAGIVFAAWRRPWRAWSSFSIRTKCAIVAWAAVLAAMNSCFYIAIDRLPLSTVASVEFIGPVLLAVVGIRSRQNALAIFLAAAGVYLLTGMRLELELIGLLFAFANAALFTLYIVLGHRVAQGGRTAGIDALGIAMLLAAGFAAPIGIADAGDALLDPIALLAGVGVGITSSVIPYVFDQLALGRLTRATYSLFVSILPATATVIGIVVLAQIPALRELFGVALVISGVATHQSPGDKAPPAQPEVPGLQATHQTPT